MVEFGTRLRELRKERKMTQGQVASQLGVTASMVSAYENGIRQPSFGVLVQLAQIYHVSTDYLLGVSGKRSADSQYVVSLDGLTPDKIAVILQLIDLLKT